MEREINFLASLQTRSKDILRSERYISLVAVVNMLAVISFTFLFLCLKMPLGFLSANVRSFQEPCLYAKRDVNVLIVKKCY